MLKIRTANTEDAATIQTLAERIWWPTYTPILEQEQIRYMLDTIYNLPLISSQIKTGEQEYLLAIQNDAPVGFASFATRKENEEVYKLHKIYCLPETKGQGMGKKLLEEVENIVIQRGKNTLELNVNKYNPARGFYEKMGFEIIYEEDIPIGPYWMNDYVLRKTLI